MPAQSDRKWKMCAAVGHQRHIRGLKGNVGAAAPMTLPTVAFAIAGASVAPSPTIATFVCARSLRIASSTVLGVVMASAHGVCGHEACHCRARLQKAAREF